MENKYTYFLASKFVGGSSYFVLLYSDQDGNAKRFKAEDITYRKILSRIITSLPTEKVFMTNHMILI